MSAAAHTDNMCSQARSDSEFESRLKPPVFDSSKQVRILLFRELNGQERRLIFDSKSVRKKDPSTCMLSKFEKPPTFLGVQRSKENSIEKSFKLSEVQSREYTYEWQKTSSDEEMLREMIFGSVSISNQGTMLKVHTMRSPLQIMISVVFPAPASMFRIGGQDLEESGTWNASTHEINIARHVEKVDTQLAHSVPVNVPSRLPGPSCDSSDSDSLQSHDGFSSLPSNHLSPETSATCLPRSSSFNSLQRRLLRNKATSIEMGLQKPDVLPEEECSRSAAGQKRVKLGLSIVVNLNEDDKQEEKQFHDFLFTHMSLIESHVMSLKEVVVRAYLNRRNFVHLMFEGSKKFQLAVSDLYTAPRLQNPEWLTIISSTNHRHLSYCFIKKFSSLLKQYDKKETNFFVSTLLTAVLTHHLAWVPSVIPTDSKIQSTQTSHKHTPCWVDLLAKSRPYNPHWVQLSDLYGALGYPVKLSKTVVKGQKRDVVLRFLQMLSYFIRCSDICEQLYEKSDDSDTLSLSSFSQGTEVPVKGGRSLETILDLSHNSSCSENSCSTSKSGLPQSSNDFDSLPASSSNSTTSTKATPCDTSLPLDLIATDTSLYKEDSVPVPCDVPISSCIDSLGYVSLEDNIVKNKIDVKGKRPALHECQANSQTDILRICCDKATEKSGRENNPLISISRCSEQCSEKAPKCCEQCPCSGSQVVTKEMTFSVGKTRECESGEEGYHSMEEPHSPSQEKLQLSEILKRCDNWSPEGLTEMPLPEIHCCGEKVDSTPYKSLGWSLMAGVTDHYLQDFCLQGLQGQIEEEEIRQSLVQSSQLHVLGETISEAVCIIADTDKWNVHLLSSNFIGSDKPGSMGVSVAMSSLVSGICDAVLNMSELDIPPESCIIYLEDKLQELYFRSQMISEYLGHKRSPLPLSRIASILNVDISDMPLLLSVATTHSPYLNSHNR